MLGDGQPYFTEALTLPREKQLGTITKNDEHRSCEAPKIFGIFKNSELHDL